MKLSYIRALVLLVAFGITNAGSATIIYVDADANGVNDGSSWMDSYNYLQNALADANSGDEIWVAQGIYKPDQGAGVTTGDQTATFQLKNGVAIKGGYAGYGEPDPNARDIDGYETILSGDLDGDDVDVNDPCDLLTEPTRAENCYHVLTGSGTNLTAVLDGFVITAGNANDSGSWPYTYDRGGGLINYYGSSTISNCTFKENLAGLFGGGIYNCNSGLKLTNCIFIHNVSRIYGGGMSEVSHGTTTLTNCRFIGNRAVHGGGMYSRSGSMPILTNCMFVGNSADLGGATSHFGLADATYTKCTFAANSALHGYAILCASREAAYPSNVQLKSCIIWDGGEEIWNCDNSVITITYSDVYGTWPGEGNIDEDPCFADANNGDYHLKSQVGRWEPNSQQWVQDDVTSPCIDAGNPADPVGHEPFPNGGIINMGAYGGTAEASKSYFGEPVCETIVAGDINGDCKVNFLDFRLMALHWLEEK